MDSKLEHIDIFMGNMMDDIVDPERELAFAILSVDHNDPATLDWLAVCAIERAAELRGN